MSCCWIAAQIPSLGWNNSLTESPIRFLPLTIAKEDEVTIEKTKKRFINLGIAILKIYFYQNEISLFTI